jgi:hypothetical protein
MGAGAWFLRGESVWLACGVLGPAYLVLLVVAIGRERDGFESLEDPDGGSEP